MVAAHPDRHAMTDDDLIAVIDDRHFVDFSDGENKALWRINDGGKTVDPHAAEIRHRKTSALKFFRFHSLVPSAVGKLLDQLADFPQRFVLRSADHLRQQPIFNRDGEATIIVSIWHDGIASDSCGNLW